MTFGYNPFIDNFDFKGASGGGGTITSVFTANAIPQFVLSGSTETVDFGITNLIIGTKPLGITTAQGNLGYGTSCLTALASNIRNTAIGHGTLTDCTGDSNTALGWGSGQNYTGSESSNILIANSGVVGESHVIRIGMQGSTDGLQNLTYIAGVINTVSGRVVKTTVPGAYPYLTLITDYTILVDTSSARTINLVASPVTGTTYRIKDNVGTAATFNITITPNAGTIDGAATSVINTNWGSLDIVYNGTSWRIL